MNFINCIVRIIEIPRIKLIQDQIPFIKIRMEIPQNIKCNNFVIIEAKMWGDSVFDFERYYKINDYVLVEGSFSTTIKKISKLTIYRIYPFLLTNSNN